MSWQNANTATLIGDLLNQFKPENMGSSMKRGMVLKIFRSKIKEAAGEKLATLVSNAKMVGDFDNPTLIIYCQSHMVRHELHMKRLKIKELINERLKSEFIKKVIVK